ncbi:amidase family protein [Bradyrhizobium sp. ISRA435]|nr:amidase family protein [Bradyrhizobium sp. ISRA435]
MPGQILATGMHCPPESAEFAALRPPRLDTLRIALSPTLGFPEAKIDAGVESCIRNAASALAKAGASVAEADPPDLSRCSEVHGVLWTAFSALLARNLGSRRGLLDASLQSLAGMGDSLPALGLLDALVARGETGRSIREFFTAYDLIVCPVFPTTAPRLDSIDGSRPLIPHFTSWCNQLGLPAASINCGMTSDGLPVGLQVIGPQYADALVLAVSLAIEELLGPAPAPRAEAWSGLMPA